MESVILAQNDLEADVYGTLLGGVHLTPLRLRKELNPELPYPIRLMYKNEEGHLSTSTSSQALQKSRSSISEKGQFRYLLVQEGSMQ